MSIYVDSVGCLPGVRCEIRERYDVFVVTVYRGAWMDRERMFPKWMTDTHGVPLSKSCEVALSKARAYAESMSRIHSA